MARQRYLEAILTILALELLWLGLGRAAPAVTAQSAPTPVIITGVQIDTPARADAGSIPVSVVAVETRVPLRITAETPLKVTVAAPVKVEADRPLKVESVDYTPKPRPGM